MNMTDEIIKRVNNLTLDQQKKVLENLHSLQQGKKRKSQRLKAKSDIDVVIGERVIQTDTRDISASGVYVNATGKFDMGTIVRLLFLVPGHNTPFKLQGEITRTEKNGMAIKFENITPYFNKILDDAIWKNIDPNAAVLTDSKPISDVQNRFVRIMLIDGTRINGQININRSLGYDRLSDLISSSQEPFLVLSHVVIIKQDMETHSKHETLLINKDHILWAEPDEDQK